MKTSVLKWIISICLYLVLLTPFLVSGKFLFPFITPKTIFFRCLIEIALFFYILLILTQSKYRPRLTPLTWTVLIYVLVITLAGIFGVNPYSSFWGNVERGEGLLTIYHLIIFFILISAFFKTKKDWLRFLDISILVSLLVSFYALGQKLNVGFLLASAGGTRLTATIGNASFLAAYLLLNIFLCLFLFINRKERSWRIYYGLAFLFELFILFETETRGALLGFFGGLLLLVILSIIFSKNKKIKLGLAALLLFLIVFASSVWFCRDQAWVVHTAALHRLTTISLTDITTQSRLLTWRASWQGWQDRFFLGYGYENYNIAFNKYFPVLIYRDPGSQIWFDRAHNVIFDQVVTNGLFGLLTYLSIFGMALWMLWPKLKHSLEGTILIGFLAAYFVQNFFVFDTLGTYIMFYSVLGLINFLSNQPKESEEIPQKEQIYFRKRPSSLLIVILILLLIFFLYFFNIRLALANRDSIKAMIEARKDSYKESIDYFKKAITYQTNQNYEIRQNLAVTAIQASASQKLTQEEISQIFDYAIEEMQKAIQAAPLDVRNYMFLMNLYGHSYQFEPKRLELVISLGEKSLELSPTRPQIYFEMGQAAMNQGRYQKGIEYFKKGVEINPSVIESHWNLAAAYIIAGQDDLAEQEFILMEEKDFDYYSMDNLKRLVKPYLMRQNFQKIAWLYEEMIKLEPDNPNLYAKLAAVYKEIGQIEKARQAVQKAVELDPNFVNEATIFLKSLEEK